jgi:hypothetical protein
MVSASKHGGFGFQEIAKQSWEKPVHSQNKARLLHIKLSRLAKALKQLSKAKSAILRQESTEAAQLVLQLVLLQEARQLTEEDIGQ